MTDVLLLALAMAAVVIVVRDLSKASYLRLASLAEGAAIGLAVVLLGRYVVPLYASAALLAVMVLDGALLHWKVALGPRRVVTGLLSGFSLPMLFCALWIAPEGKERPSVAPSDPVKAMEDACVNKTFIASSATVWYAYSIEGSKHVIWQLDRPRTDIQPLPLTAADTFNHVEGRFLLSVTAIRYRSFHPDDAEWTPWKFATLEDVSLASTGYHELVRFVIEHGVDPRTKTSLWSVHQMQAVLGVTFQEDVPALQDLLKRYDIRSMSGL